MKIILLFLAAFAALAQTPVVGPVWTDDGKTLKTTRSVAIGATVTASNVFRGANTVVLFGDSIMMLNDTGTGPASTGYFAWANAMLGQRFNVLANNGISGNTTAQMLARIQTDVIAWQPSWCVVDGGANDITGGTMTASQIWANLKSIYTILLSNGIEVVAVTLPPSSSYTVPMATQWADINYRLKEYARITPNFILVDYAAAYTDQASATAAPLSGYTEDGIHPTPAGAYLAGKLFNSAVAPLIPAIPVLPVSNFADPGNLLSSNGLMTGTGGNLNSAATGSLANGWTAIKAGTITCAVSKTARTDGLGEYQVITITGGTNGTTYCQVYIDAAGWSIGQTLIAQFEMASATVTHSIFPVVLVYDSGFTQIAEWDLFGTAPTDVFLNQTLGAMTFRSLPGVVPAGAAHIFLEFRIAGTTGTVSIGRAEVRALAPL